MHGLVTTPGLPRFSCWAQGIPLDYRNRGRLCDLSGHSEGIKPTAASLNRPMRFRMAANLGEAHSVEFGDNGQSFAFV